MELGQYQIQVFVSLVVILCAACITAICEFVKNRQGAQAETQPASGAVDPAQNVKNPKRRKGKTKASSDAWAVMERGRQLATVVQVSEPKIFAGPSPSATKVTLALPTEVASVSEPKVPSLTPSIDSPTPESGDSSTVFHAGFRTAPPTPLVSAEEVPALPIASGKRDWGAVLKSSRANQEPRPLPMKDRVTMTVASSINGLPSGLQDGFVLTQLVQSRQPVTGLVVSIGVQIPNGADVPNTVHAMVQTLLGPGDFAAQVSEREYLLIFPSERGLSAERRLAGIAEKLANASVESESYEILFNCGGVEVRSEAIDRALASAAERMHAVGRGPKVVLISESSIRRAV